jgi:glutamate/aspartate transport system substrate-binding protein
MMAKGDAPFKKIVDGVITDLLKSGAIKPIYTKWFEEPIPPRQIKLNFAMSDDVKALYANPTDTAIQ